MMKKAIIGILLLCCLSFAAAAGSDELLPYSKVKEQFPARWQQTFDTVNGPVTIDAAITLPDCDALPLLEVTLMTFDPAALAAAFPGAEIALPMSDATAILVKMGDFPACIRPIDVSMCEQRDGDAAAEYAENAVFSRHDVEAFALEKLSAIDLPEGVTFHIKGTMTNGRTWRVDPQGQVLEPLNDHGYYSTHLYTSVHGIPVADCPGFHQDHEKLHGPRCYETILSYYDAENYWFTLGAYAPAATLMEDCPLLPFSSIQRTVEGLITSGHLRRIDRFELCYVPMWSDDGQRMITVPAWVLHGEYHEMPKSPTYPEPVPYYLRTIGGDPIVIPAQTGKPIDYASRSKDRWKASSYFTEAIP